MDLAGLPAILSYAGRVAHPKVQPLPTRTGGFGGIAGLTEYLRGQSISHLVDATHPFAAQMSAHAMEAAAQAGVPLIALQRPAWQPDVGDRWTAVPDIESAARALAGKTMRVFLAIGRQHLAQFATQPQHHYLLRLVDPPQSTLPLPHVTTIIARGPFETAHDLHMLRTHQIDTIVAKNSGGFGAVAKIHAARMLRLPVIMIDRPRLPARQIAPSVHAVMDWIGH